LRAVPLLSEDIRRESLWETVIVLDILRSEVEKHIKENE